MFILIILVLSVLITYIFQETIIDNKKQYKNNMEKYFDKVKIPILVGCIVGIIYSINKQDGKNINQQVYMSMPNF